VIRVVTAAHVLSLQGRSVAQTMAAVRIVSSPCSTLSVGRKMGTVTWKRSVPALVQCVLTISTKDLVRRVLVMNMEVGAVMLVHVCLGIRSVRYSINDNDTRIIIALNNP